MIPASNPQTVTLPDGTSIVFGEWLFSTLQLRVTSPGVLSASFTDVLGTVDVAGNSFLAPSHRSLTTSIPNVFAAAGTELPNGWSYPEDIRTDLLAWIATGQALRARILSARGGL